MSRNPRVTGAVLVTALMKAGFVTKRIKGSHHFLSHDDGRRTVVPIHSGETIGPGLFLKVLRDCRMDVEELRGLIEE